MMVWQSTVKWRYQFYRDSTFKEFQPDGKVCREGCWREDSSGALYLWYKNDSYQTAPVNLVLTGDELKINSILAHNAFTRIKEV